MPHPSEFGPDGPLYEQAFFRRSAGKTLRPGGQRVTLQGLYQNDLLVEDGFGGWKAVCPGLRAVDVGCGAGATMDLLYGLGFAVTGIDPSASMRKEASDWLPDNVAILEGEAACMPLSSDSYDVVLCECVLSLVTDKGKALQEISRILRPGGTLLWSDLYVREGGQGIFPRTANPMENDHAAQPDFPASSCMAGAITMADMLWYLKQAGFLPTMTEDHSPALRQLAGQLVFDGAGEEWTAWLGAACGSGRTPRRVGRLGYILITATKEPV